MPWRMVAPAPGTETTVPTPLVSKMMLMPEKSKLTMLPLALIFEGSAKSVPGGWTGRNGVNW